MASYTLGAIDIQGTIIEQLDSAGLDPALTHMVRGAAGSVDTEMIANIDQEPTLRFTTTQIEEMLDLCFLDGLAISAASPVILWFREITAGGTLTAIATTNHIKVTCNLGLLTLETIDAGLTDPASADYQLRMLYDGTNNPFVVESGVAYGPTPGNVTEKYFKLGKGWLEEVAVGRIQSFRLNTNLQVDVQKEGGSIWPVQASIVSRQPTWEWDTLDTAIMDSTPADGIVPGLLGNAIDASGTKSTRAFLQEVVKGAALTPEATAAHIRFEVTEGVVSVGAGNFQPQQNAPLTVTVTPSWDGVNAVMQYTKDVAISAA